MALYMLILIFSAAGVFEAGYLLNRRKNGQRPVCPIGEDSCHVVLESKYKNLIFGIPNELSGILFYSTAAAISILLLIGIDPKYLLDPALKILVFAGAAMSLVFTYLQWRVLKAWCFWCLMSALTTFLMAAAVIIFS